MNRTFVYSRNSRQWNTVKHFFVEWRRRARSRNELRKLDEATLHDIGLSRCSAARETTKPFWMA